MEPIYSVMDSDKDRKNKRKIYLDTNLQLVFGITLVQIMGISIITPAFPKLVKYFNISAEDIGLLITFFTLPGILLAPILGFIADRWGRKKIIIPALMLFGIAGGACFFVRDFETLLILRLFQGIGAAPIGILGTTIIGDLYYKKELVVAMGYNSTVRNIGSASYPTIGGALTLIGWHYPFILPVIAIPVGFLVLFFLNNPESRHNHQNIKDHLYNVWNSIRNLKVIGFLILGTTTFIILFGSYMTFFPFLMENFFEASPLIIGIIMSIMSFTAALTSSQLGKMISLYPKKILLLIAFSFYTLALIIIPFVPKLWQLLIPIIILGIAHGINIPVIHTIISEMAHQEYRATFFSISGMFFRLGQTIGPILMGLFFSFWGIRAPFYFGAVLALIMIITINFIYRYSLAFERKRD